MNILGLLGGWQAKAIAAGVLAVGLLAGGVYLHHKWYSAGAAAGEARALAAERERDSAVKNLLDSQRTSKEYSEEINRLRTAKRPDPVVRVCPAPRVVQVPVPATGTDGAPAEGGSVPEPVGRDIGPDLARLTEQADELSARLRALQAWVDRVQQ